MFLGRKFLDCYKLRWKLPTELKISHTIADADGMGDKSRQ